MIYISPSFIKYFNSNDTNKIELENEQLKLMLELKTNNNDNSTYLNFSSFENNKVLPNFKN